MFQTIELLSDHLHGDKFADMCEFCINDRGRRLDEISNRNATVFCRTDDIPELFNLIRDNGKKYILVTGNSDHNINEERYSWKPANIMHWFAQNALVKRDDLTAIPIGLERPGVAGSGNIDDFIHNVTGTWTKNAHCYANFSNSTNPTRPTIKTYLKQTHWCNIQEDRIQIRHFLAELRRHNFVFSPPGNGVDCHRTWEALYSGSIPICDNSVCNQEFLRILPMVIYDNYTDITIEFLQQKRTEIQNKLKNNQYTLNSLKFQFWRDLIHYYGRSLL